MAANLENSAVATGLEKVSFPIAKKDNAKECSTPQLHLLRGTKPSWIGMKIARELKINGKELGEDK